MEEQQYIFTYIHVFKAGGTFFTGGLRYTFKDPEEMYLVNISPEHPTSYQNKNQEQRNKIKVVHGHTPFGIHKTFCRPAVYLTVVRDPVDRVLSTYYNILEDKCANHPLHLVFKKFSLEECMSSDIYNKLDDTLMYQFCFAMHNHQVRMFTGLDRTEKLKYEADATGLLIGEKDLDRAVSNLRNNFSFIGICDETDYYWPFLQQKFKFDIPEKVWHSSDWRFANRTKSRPQQADLPLETIKLIKEFNKFDVILYENILTFADQVNNGPVKIIG